MPASSSRSEPLARAAAVLLALACSAAAVPAHDGAHAPGKAASVSADWNFTLPTLAGDRFVALRSLAGPVLVNFWGVDCPPCVAELPALMAFARAQPQWTVLLVGTDKPAVAQPFLERYAHPLPANVLPLRGGANTPALLRAAGNRQAALPHSVAWSRGAACKSHSGMLDDALLQQMARACTQ
jgi:outer membrane receptor for ferrienterochelin and colicins